MSRPRALASRAAGPCLRLLLVPALAAPGGCATLGAAMSPYSETYSCKNDDHGQCIHPEKALDDALAGRTSRSDPAVTNDRRLLQGAGRDRARGMGRARSEPRTFEGYRDSVYRELADLIAAPVTPMLRPARTLRTLVLPYTDRNRPDRLYMPRYVYWIPDRPEWVVGDYLVAPVPAAVRVPVLEQVREPGPEGDAAVPQP